jgi:hypothetical protein
MIWSFERSGQRLSCEIRRDEDGQYYEFVVSGPDGTERTERYEEPSEVVTRSVDVMRGLIEEGWHSLPVKAASIG